MIKLFLPQSSRSVKDDRLIILEIWKSICQWQMLPNNLKKIIIGQESYHRKPIAKQNFGTSLCGSTFGKRSQDLASCE